MFPSMRPLPERVAAKDDQSQLACILPRNRLLAAKNVRFYEKDFEKLWYRWWIVCAGGAADEYDAADEPDNYKQVLQHECEPNLLYGGGYAGEQRDGQPEDTCEPTGEEGGVQPGSLVLRGNGKH